MNKKLLEIIKNLSNTDKEKCNNLNIKLNLLLCVEVPQWLDEYKQEDEDKLAFAISNILYELKNYIKETKWKVAGFGLFKGGVINNDQRVPHCVDKIFKTIQQFEKDEINAVAAYEKIVSDDKDALIAPHRGQHKNTSNFCLDLVNHAWLAKKENRYTCISLAV
ncbi:hypothetical protein ACNVED_05875 [Legionella sp. D16C41]|uniref:hypothetical protein n=1 Tax=Legionella sp. D16C41 TaxID=3402688 RepID=UPI003AF4BAD4